MRAPHTVFRNGRMQTHEGGYTEMKKTLAIAFAAALSLGAAAHQADAFDAEFSNLANALYNQLETQGYDVTGFENLTLGQIATIKSLLESNGSSNRGMVQGILSGVCGGNLARTPTMPPFHENEDN